jgi:putative lumazine-binding protein
MRAAFVLTLLLAAAPMAAQSAADSAAIRATALDYIDGWWSGDGNRMAGALHPELVKRIRGADSSGTREWIDNQGASRLVQGTSRGGGRETPVANRRSDVRILDIFQNTASVRVDAGAWVDYLHLVRWKGRWVILNVLWELRRPS